MYCPINGRMELPALIFHLVLLISWHWKQKRQTAACRWIYWPAAIHGMICVRIRTDWYRWWYRIIRLQKCWWLPIWMRKPLRQLWRPVRWLTGAAAVRNCGPKEWQAVICSIWNPCPLTATMIRFWQKSARLALPAIPVIILASTGKWWKKNIMMPIRWKYLNMCMVWFRTGKSIRKKVPTPTISLTRVLTRS